MDQFLHTCGSHTGVFQYGKLALIKMDCKRYSRLSATQRGHNTKDTTVYFIEQLRRIHRNTKTIIVFGAKKVCMKPILEHGFMYFGNVVLNESELTDSINNSSEYMHIFSLENIKKITSRLERFKQIINGIRHQSTPITHSLMRQLEQYTHVRPMTFHQRNIYNIYRHSFPNCMSGYANIGCSIAYTTNVGGQTGSIRKPCGKIGAMGEIVVWYNDRAIKLSVGGLFLVRGINVPDIPYGTTTMWKNIVRHAVHPFYVQMVREIFV